MTIALGDERRGRAVDANRDQGVRSAEVVLPCSELGETLSFFTERLGFRVLAILPADDPRVAVIAAHGLRIRLERGGLGSPGVLRVACRDPGEIGDGARELLAPNGTRILLEQAGPDVDVPPGRPSFELCRAADGEAWRVGRAGMLYRDLVPDRQGGRFIASHIRIQDGGPVPDYVHFHRVRFQMIYCYRGWVRVVYEDQGPPFVMRAGDCVLQPPEIRHRVLECSAGLEVIEISSPAEHETWADTELPLPTPHLRPEREFKGQRFLRHEAAAAPWIPGPLAGREIRDLGLAAASNQLASGHVVRASGAASSQVSSHDAELYFLFVLRGAIELRCEGQGVLHLAEADSVVVPAGMRYALERCSNDAELLEVHLPAALGVRIHAMEAAALEGTSSAATSG